jgi:Protein of unknown function (DUF2815)
VSEEVRFETPKGRLNFPFLIKPRPKDPKDTNSKERYSLTLVFDVEAQETPEWKKLEKAVKDLALAKFGVEISAPDGTKKRVVPKGVKNPIKLASEKFEKDGVTVRKGYDSPGAKFISATSNYAPGVIDGNQVKITDEKTAYPGCYCRATVTVFPYDRSDSKGVSLGLRNVQKVAEGERLGGGQIDAAKEFGKIEGYAPAAAGSAQADFEATGADEDVPF